MSYSCHDRHVALCYRLPLPDDSQSPSRESAEKNNTSTQSDNRPISLITSQSLSSRQLVALIIGSCTTATDPVLSNAIVKGAFADQYVSPSLRNLISAESGANDGFGYPFLFLAVHLLKSSTTSGALKTWVLDTILYQVVGSVVHGAVIGYIALRALRYSSEKNWIDKESFLLWCVGLALFTVGSGGMLGVDDLLAAFVMGNVLTWDDFYRKETESDEIQNCVDLLL